MISGTNAVVISAMNNSSDATKTVDGLATITSAPGIAEPFQINTCSFYNATESRTLWNNPWCSMYVGTVDLVFWPTTGNHSYPSTYRDTISDYTFTSPSVYMIVNTMYAENPCGPLGPSASREIFAFDLTEVSTLVPYTDETASTRRATRQLQLSDLDTHCTRSFNRSELATQTRPLKNDDTRCNPFLTVPKKFKEHGYPYWLHCGIKNNKFGVFDPPYAIPALDELVPARTTLDQKPNADNPTAAPSASAKAPATVGSVETAVASLHNNKPASAGPGDAGATASLEKPKATVMSSGNTERTSIHRVDAGAMVSPGHTETVDSSGNNNASPDEHGAEGVVSHQGNTKASAVTVGHADQTTHEETLQSAGDTSNAQESVIGPGIGSGPTTSFHGVISTVTKQVVSLGTAGLEVVNNDTGETSIYAVPAAGAPHSDVGLIPASKVVYNGHTIAQGGPALTVTSAVVMFPYAASSTEKDTASVITTLDEDSSTLSAVANSPANKVIRGTYSLVLAMLAYGWMHL
ncbi:hypothetical protein FOMG_19309 [Fusarium oxysporum f. sp. melonis 26406]|uniref:Uncharacterized protein n=1 Tax=Fusarium oxysporum f. sp. melonis 26406 TaxID=1089452 RepID=W9YWK4_FUSOX|nr:hypothetical protein FOMG_19309 [Fusarium oxysporum f. sp. melonis 26406]